MLHVPAHVAGFRSRLDVITAVGRDHVGAWSHDIGFDAPVVGRSYRRVGTPLTVGALIVLTVFTEVIGDARAVAGSPHADDGRRARRGVDGEGIVAQCRIGWHDIAAAPIHFNLRLLSDDIKTRIGLKSQQCVGFEYDFHHVLCRVETGGIAGGCDVIGLCAGLQGVGEQCVGTLIDIRHGDGIIHHLSVFAIEFESQLIVVAAALDREGGCFAAGNDGHPCRLHSCGFAHVGDLLSGIAR